MWSRAAQVQCVSNCPSCLLTSKAIARRATTAAARRTIRVGDVYTVSLSLLAAGLALESSRKKDDRRKQWDKVIGETRATVEATEIQQQRRLTALSDDARVEVQENTRASRHDVTIERGIKKVEAWDTLEDSEKPIQQVLIPDDRMDDWLGVFDGASEKPIQQVPIRKFLLPDYTSDNWLDVFDWAREQHNLREASGFQDWKGLPLSLLQALSKDQLHQLLSDERLLRCFYGGPDCDSLVYEQSRTPFSMKKIRTLEWSVAKLVWKLLLHCSRNSLDLEKNSESPTDSLLRGLAKDEEAIEAELVHMRQALRTLNSERRSHFYYEKFESPQMPNYDDRTIEKHGQRTKLNLSLQKLLDSMEQESDLSDLMSKICYNLLTARTPPNTHTYNMLLVRFCELGKEDLVKAILTSMCEAHIRPNEITHVNFLRHFTATRNGVEFWKYWQRMEGYRSGLSLAPREQKIHPILQGRYRIFGGTSQKAAEKGRMNGQVYESLIVGALDFLGRQTAMRYYRNMVSEGWGPSVGILLAILKDCCHRSDWTAGTAVLEQLEMTAESINSLTYEWMLRLCQCCGQLEFFDQILRNGVHCGALPASMLDLPDHAKAEDISFLIERGKELQPRKAIGMWEETAASISHRLGDKSPFLLENAFHACEDEDMLRHTINRTNDRWKARLAIQKKLKMLSIKINRAVVEANRALYALKHLSSVKFWLSRRVQYLEKELEQIANGVPYASNSDVVRFRNTQKTQARRAENGEGDRGNAMNLPVAAGSSQNEAAYLSHLLLGVRRREPVQWNTPSLPPMTDTPGDSFTKDHELANGCYGAPLTMVQ